MKYFFLSEGWIIGRVWEFGGLWDESVWRRKPQIKQINVYIWEKDEKMCLYRVEDAVLMVEVRPSSVAALNVANQSIGQVILKRLISADEVIE